MSRQIAVINAGSSSIKFAVFNEGGRDQELMFRGQIENIGVAPKLHVEKPDGEKLVENEWGAKDLDHRLIHGGTQFTGPTAVTMDLIKSLKSLIPLAPLHQPHNVAPMEAIMSEAPLIPQAACFDTAFHQTQEHLAQA